MNGRRCRNAVRGRFKADGGEVVVGRVTEIQGGRWIVDIDGAKLSLNFFAIKWSKNGHKSPFWTKITRFF